MDPIENLAIGVGSQLVTPRIAIKTLDCEFTRWMGEPLTDPYGKTVLCWKGQPLFAELIIVAELKAAGWNAYWADTFSQRFRSGWQPNLARGEQGGVSIQEFRSLLPAARHPIAFEQWRGIWDVIAWGNGSVRFYELKGERDQLRETQKEWLETVLQSGAELDEFRLINW